MMNGRLEIQWTPVHNRFITWGNEVCLYEVQTVTDPNVQRNETASTTTYNLLATNNNHHYIKCLDVCPSPQSDILFAIGQSNGRITLSTFGPSVHDTHGLPGKELLPKYPRQCNAIAWNPIDRHRIAAGLDKYRTDASILLWDIHKCPPTANSTTTNNLIDGATCPTWSTATASNSNASAAAMAVELARPVNEFGVSDTTNSLAWFTGNSNLLAAGMNGKVVRLIDFRDPYKAANSASTKSVYGVCVDHSSNDRHLASFHDYQISIWDTRNFEKPISTLAHLKHIRKIAWCPTRHNLLGALERECSTLNLYDIKHTMVGNEEIEPSVLERVIIPGSPHNITSFSWHEHDKNRLLSIAISGQITDYTVSDRITLNWAPNSNIVWSYGQKVMKCMNTNSSWNKSLGNLRPVDTIHDISHKTRERAFKEYGLKDELYLNGELADDKYLQNIWNWLYKSSKLVEENPLLRSCQTKHPGVQSVLKLEPNVVKSETISVPMDAGNGNNTNMARIHKHEDRDRALLLCGWNLGTDGNVLQRQLDQLERDGAYGKAATLALWNLRVRQAVDILNRGGGVGSPVNPDSGDISSQHSNDTAVVLSVMALAVVACCADKVAVVWRQLAAFPRNRLSDPYLRAMFAFITAENYNYDAVLNETGVSLDDRVAFASIFLPDNKLYEYIRSLTSKLVEEGNLEAILLTGNDTEGLRLLQRYLDNTNDIQSTALLAIRAFNSESANDWIQSYRNLLDTWQLWNERALFDIMLSQHRSSEKHPQQVFVSCNFCGKSISLHMQGLNRRQQFSRIGGTPNKLKMSSCPNCRKPLPRCAICMMHMGTITAGVNSISTDVDSCKMVEFANWFTWCQTCRHGGHASHMTHWFNEHSECPVTACTCRCFSLDAMGNLSI